MPRNILQVVILCACLQFFSINIFSQSSISFGTGTNPSNTVIQGDPASFTLNIINSLGSQDQLNSYFTVKMPSVWKLVGVSGYEIEKIDSGNQLENAYKVSGLDLLGNGQSVNPVVQIRALCGAKGNNEQLTYHLYSSAGSLLTGPIIHEISTNIITPSFRIGGLGNIQTVKNRLEEREYSIAVNNANGYSTNLKIEIERPSITDIYIHNISFKNKEGNFTSINDMPLSRVDSVGNNYIISIQEDVFQAITDNDRLSYNDSIILREAITLTKCQDNAGSSSLSYSFYYGDGQEWCYTGISKQNTISILAKVPQPWIEWVTTAGSSNFSYATNIIPTKSNATSIANGRGQRIYRIANYSEEDIPLRDIRTKFSTGVAYLNKFSGQFVIETAYFCDENGNRLLDEQQDILVDRNGIPGDKTAYTLAHSSKYVPYQDILRFDLLTQEQITDGEGNKKAPLVCLDNDNLYNDLPAGEWFYFATEYNIDYEHFEFDSKGDIYRNNFLSFWRSYMNLYYLDDCGNYQPFGFDKSTSNENALTPENYPTILLRPDRQIRAVGTNNGETVVNVGLPIISLNDQQQNEIRDIRPLDQAAVKVQVPPISGGLSRANFLVSNANIKDPYVHTVRIKLPAGFLYDNNYGIKIRQNQEESSSLIPISGVIVTTDSIDGKQIVEFRNTVFFSNKNTWIYVGMKDDNTDNKNNPRTDKNVEFSFLFNYKGETPVEYAYFTIPLDYNKVFPCDLIELSSFKSERTSFGYKDKTMKERAVKEDGINLKVAGPYHNVSHIGEIKIHQDVHLSTNEKFLVKLSYQLRQIEPYFSFPDENKAIAIQYKKAGESNFRDSIFVTISEINQQIQNEKHEIILDLTDKINKSELFLNQDDEFIITFLTQATENIPRVPTPINELQMETYTETEPSLPEDEPIINSCGPLAESFKLFNYKLGSVVAANAGSFELNGEGSGGIARWQIQNGSPGNSEEFTNEFVPNSTFTTMTVTLNGIFIIDEISVYSGGSNADNSNVGTSSTNAKVLDKSIYDINYLEGKTIITLTNDPNTPTIESEVWDSYGAGFYFLSKFHFVGALPEDLMPKSGKVNAQRASISIEARDYPTSEKPIERNYSLALTDFIAAFTYNDYFLTPISGSSVPGIGDAEWEFNLTNNSPLLDGKGRFLQNSWFSLECEPGLLYDIILYEKTQEGETEVGSFVEVGNDSGKFWIKLGTLEVRSNKSYVIRSKQNACDEGTYPVQLVYGMNNSVDGHYDGSGMPQGTPLYPTDPWTGFESEFNTHEVLNTQGKGKLSLSLRVNQTQFFVEAKDPNYTDGKLYSLCEPFTIEASFANGQDFKIIDLGLKIHLQLGLAFDESSVQVKIGNNGEWNTFNNLDIDTNNSDFVLISFPDNFILEEYGKPQDKVIVKFDITPSCGYNGRNITIDMLGKKYCGTDIQKRIYTNMFPVTFVTAEDPVINFQGTTIKNQEATDNHDNPIEIAYDPANDGSFEMKSTYLWTANSTPFYIYIDFPEGLKCNAKVYIDKTSTTLDLNQLQGPDGESGATKHVGVEIPNIGNGNFPVNLEITATFEPDENSNLDCSTYSIRNWTAVTKELTGCPSAGDPAMCNTYTTLTQNYSILKYNKLTDLDITVEGEFDSETSELIVIKGKVSSNVVDGDEFDFNIIGGLYVDEDDNYRPITGTDNSFTANITNSQLIFETLPFTIQSNELCKLVLIIKKEDNPYLCEDIILPLNEISYKIKDNHFILCEEDNNLQIGEKNQINYSYRWYEKNDPSTILSTLSEYQLPDNLSGGKYEYIMEITRPGGCFTNTSVWVEVNTRTVWMPQNSGTDDDKQNWNDPLNWSTGLVPIACTDVYIPGNSDFFPNLLSEEGHFCNNIYFMHGAHIGHPDLLTYSKAHVQWNWDLKGSTQDKSIIDIKDVKDIKSHLSFSASHSGGSLNRSQWHMLSAPLHNMFSGDMAFGGYPLTFMRKFNVINGPVPPSGGVVEALWTGTYSSLIEPLRLGEGWVMWINTYNDKDKYRESAVLTDDLISSDSRNIGLKEINGILEFPYYENEDMLRAHRVSKVENENQTYYVMRSSDLILNGKTESVNRGNNNKSYRFIVENYENGSWVFPKSTSYTLKFDNTVDNFEPSFIVGNPYMSMLDFKAFHELNEEVLTSNYALWYNNAFTSYTFNPVLGLLELSEGENAQIPNVKGYIDPMQSFLVKAKAGVGTPASGGFQELTLKFNTSMAVVKPQGSTRSLRAEEKEIQSNVLRIKSSNSMNSSETLIGRYDSANDSYVSGEDIYKVFSQDKSIPSLFTEIDNYAVEMNFISNNENFIPLGIYTNTLGETTLSFSGMKEFDAEKIHLIDNTAEKIIDLTNQDHLEYTFNNDVVGKNSGRYFIYISQPRKNHVNIEEFDNILFLNAYSVNKGIMAFSSQNDPILDIKVYDIEGKLLYSNNQVNSSLYIVDMNMERQIYIVKLKTKLQSKSIKINK